MILAPIHSSLASCACWLPLALAACGPRTVDVTIAIPNEHGVETPVPGARFNVLPYDRDSILRDLEARAPTPRPSTVRLDSLFQAFREPFAAYLGRSAAHDRLRQARDSVRTRLDGILRADPAYADGYDRYTALNDSLRTMEPGLDSARRELARVRARILPAADSLRRRLAAWEDTAYRAYDSITGALVRRHRHGAVNDSTRATGWARLRLPRGDWWITARAVNVADPNAEWYWNLPADADTILLSERTGKRRPRY